MPLDRSGGSFIPPVRVKGSRVPLKTDHQGLFLAPGNNRGAKTHDQENENHWKRKQLFHGSLLKSENPLTT
jgi:hypothetical protein